MSATHARATEALERALQNEHDLSLAEYEVLQRLSETGDGHLRMQELAEVSPLSASALSRLLGRLERAGLAERDICEDDRRGIWACLTDAGREAEHRAAPTYRDTLAQALDGQRLG